MKGKTMAELFDRIALINKEMSCESIVGGSIAYEIALAMHGNGIAAKASIPGMVVLGNDADIWCINDGDWKIPVVVSKGQVVAGLECTEVRTIDVGAGECSIYTLGGFFDLHSMTVPDENHYMEAAAESLSIGKFIGWSAWDNVNVTDVTGLKRLYTRLNRPKDQDKLARLATM